MDSPFNLLPSLHAALAVASGRSLRKKSSRRFLIRGNALVPSHCVFLRRLLTSTTSSTSSVVLFSPAYCFYFFREPSLAMPVVVNRRIGSYYAAGATVFLLMGAIFWPWGILLLWPAVALGIVAIVYFGAGPVVFHKTNGKLPWSTRFVLAPCLLGQYFSLLYYRSQCRPWDAVTPRLWIGGQLGSRSANKALCSGVVSVLDLSTEFSEAKPFRKTNYQNIPVLDLTAPTQEQLAEMGKFIVNHSLKGVVYVHCKIGYSRSAAAVAAYLIMSGKAKTAGEAFDHHSPGSTVHCYSTRRDLRCGRLCSSTSSFFRWHRLFSLALDRSEHS